MKLFVTTPKNIRPMILHLDGMKVNSWLFSGIGEFTAGFFDLRYREPL